ncbi:MAG: DUF2867 domain-containing protein [Saprospiraceae bacterium]
MVKEVPPPTTEGIKNALPRLDFIDTFATTNHKNSLAEIAHFIFATAPNWVKTLFYIRNTLVRLVGLKTDYPVTQDDTFEVGNHVGFFKIYQILDNEVILGADDSHLNFRVSILNNQAQNFNIEVTTLVEFNNTLGRIYMKIIAPFHRLVVKAMMKQAYHPNPAL